MENFDYEYICKQMAKSSSSTVRVYEDGKQLYRYSVWNIHPDPIGPYLEEILHTKASYGVITTPLFQFCSFLDIHKRYRFVMGPSGLISTDKKGIDELLLEIGIPKEARINYVHSLRCPPAGSLEKTFSILRLLSYSLNEVKLEAEGVFLNKKTAEQYSSVASSNMETTMELVDVEEPHLGTEQAYSFEVMLTEMIRGGEVEKMAVLTASQPVLKSGDMAHDTLRQMKNESICGATVAARAAIEGGLDCTTAFQISDIFIQKSEMMTNYNALRQLQMDLFMDYAVRVQEANHGLENCSDTFIKCAKYVLRNIAHHITVDNLATHLHISRAYLCTLFKKETQMTLTEYIQKEKVLEAQRLLKHTDHSLLEIADYLAFSSQSHFQTVFKKITAQTPSQYRAAISRRKHT